MGPVKVEFETDNDAFMHGNRRREVARILRRIAERVESGHDDGKAMDINGNSVGQWSLD